MASSSVLIFACVRGNDMFMQIFLDGFSYNYLRNPTDYLELAVIRNERQTRVMCSI